MNTCLLFSSRSLVLCQVFLVSVDFVVVLLCLSPQHFKMVWDVRILRDESERNPGTFHEVVQGGPLYDRYEGYT